ncbi:unnamed protein product [Ceutorhynchus assimilis]|uniref:Secreted protein n=1 Tax=Ceutorhynchus assimilis TaxID=467358 RepID=A0A9N9MST5_9CUCU|nr:unnamed protein product [Ceutorhynchus assimilis]
MNIVNFICFGLLVALIEAQAPVGSQRQQQGLPQEYGPPNDVIAEATTRKDFETIDERSRKLNGKLTQNKNSDGAYYIYHPTGLLQKVTYATKDNLERMAFSARLRYENVEPVYTYDPITYVFKKLQ